MNINKDIEILKLIEMMYTNYDLANTLLEELCKKKYTYEGKKEK